MANEAILTGGMATRKEQNMKTGLAAVPGEIIYNDTGEWATPAAAAPLSALRPWGVLDVKKDGGLTTAYANGEKAVGLIPMLGNSQFQCILASGENVAKWAALEVAANGRLQALTAGAVVAVALEAVDASAAEARIKVLAWQDDLLSDGVVIQTTATLTLTAADNGKTIFAAVAELVVTLPATFVGGRFTFIVKTLSTVTGLSISPVAADAIHGGGLTSVDDEDLVNTAATDAEGDSVTIVADGVDGWFIESINGTWAKV